MKHLLKYLGRRAETLGKYDNPTLRGGPYDFSKGECEVDEKDAEVLIRDNPVGFKNLGPVQPREEKAKKELPRTVPQAQTQQTRAPGNAGIPGPPKLVDPPKK